VDSYALDSYEINNIDVGVLLFQTGYLTIKEQKINSKDFSTSYILAYPNKEVRDSFYTFLIGEFTGTDKTNFTGIVNELKENLERCELDAFIKNIKTIFAGIPYNIFVAKREAFYHTVIYLILKMLGMRLDVEVQTNLGRLDTVVVTDKYVYIMEYKLDTPEKAIQQIQQKKYYEKYMDLDKEIIIVGIEFNKEERNIKNFEYKKIKQ
jgi:hypothetical protein